MKFKIDNKILEQFPQLNIGIVIARAINNTTISYEIMNSIQEESKAITANFSKETLSANPKITAWREAYSSFGAKPKKYRCSVENLYRMILDGAELRHINKIVDIYNYISIKHMVPVGGDDIDRVDGDIALRLALGNEPFIRLNSQEIEYPKEGEVVYTDDKEVLCRRWNWRECDKSKMTEDTTNATLVVEGLPPVTSNEIETILEELSALVQKFCGGEIKTFILNSATPEMEI